MISQRNKSHDKAAGVKKTSKFENQTAAFEWLFTCRAPARPPTCHYQLMIQNIFSVHVLYKLLI